MSKKYFNATYNEWMDRLEDSMRKKYVFRYRVCTDRVETVIIIRVCSSGSDINIFIQESRDIQQREFNNENQFYCFNILRSSNILKRPTCKSITQ